MSKITRVSLSALGLVALASALATTPSLAKDWRHPSHRPAANRPHVPDHHGPRGADDHRRNGPDRGGPKDGHRDGHPDGHPDGHDGFRPDPRHDRNGPDHRSGTPGDLHPGAGRQGETPWRSPPRQPIAPAPATGTPTAPTAPSMPAPTPPSPTPAPPAGAQ